MKGKGLKIKVCGMRDPENITELMKLKPDYIGFILFPGSKRFVGEAFQLPGEFPKGIKKVGVFVNAELPDVIKWRIRLSLDSVQLHGDESPEYCRELKKMGISIIKSFNIYEKFDFSMLQEYLLWCDYFLFDTPSEQRGGSGKKFDWSILHSYPFDTPFILSGGIGPEDVEAIKNIKGLPVVAVDINSRFEDSPAIKNIEKLKNFFYELKR